MKSYLGGLLIVTGVMSSCLLGMKIESKSKEKDAVTTAISNFYSSYDDQYLDANASKHDAFLNDQFIKNFKNIQINIFPAGDELIYSYDVKKISSRDIQLLCHKFANFLYKKVAYAEDGTKEFKEDKYTTDVFDDLIALRLECANSLPKDQQLRKGILDFSPLVLSRWNPFGWGNWYDRLHRTVSALPSMPWNENNAEDTNKALVETHLKDIERHMENYGDSIKPIAQIYVCTMRELRFLIKKDLSPTGRKILRYTAGALGVLATVPLIRYFFGNTKSSLQSPGKEKLEETTK